MVQFQTELSTYLTGIDSDQMRGKITTNKESDLVTYVNKTKLRASLVKCCFLMFTCLDWIVLIIINGSELDCH